MLMLWFGGNPEEVAEAEALNKRVASASSKQVPRNTVMRMNAGDLDAFADLCDGMVDTLFGYAYVRCGNREVANGLVEQTCRVAWDRRSQLVDGDSFNAHAWLLRIMRELARLHYGRCFSIAPDSLTTTSAIHLALLALEPSAQEIVVLRLIFGLELDDIADIIGRPRDYVLLVQARAIRQVGLVAS